MTSTDDTTVPAHLWKYALNHGALQHAARELEQLLSSKLAESGLDFHKIESRAKDINSYAKKAAIPKHDTTPKYSDPASQIMDTVAARIILYTNTARKASLEVVKSTFKVLEHANPGEAKQNGYDSDHFVVTGFQNPELLTGYSDLKTFFTTRPGLEIQIRTVAGHAWAEYEHDIRYKPGNGFDLLSKAEQNEINRLFIEAGGSRRHLDEAFDKIEEKLRPALSQATKNVIPSPAISWKPSPIEDGFESELPSETSHSGITRDTLGTFLRTKYPDSSLPADPSFAYELKALKALLIQDIRTLETTLDPVDSQDIQRLMGYKEDPGAARHLEDDLLAQFGDEYIEKLKLTGQNKFNLEGRLRRIRGKLVIYSVDNVPELEGQFFTSSQLFRELSKETSRFKRGARFATVEGLSSSRKTDLEEAARPRRMQVPYGYLYFATNRSRGALEQGSMTLAENLPGNVVLRRAGDVFYPEA